MDESTLDATKLEFTVNSNESEEIQKQKYENAIEYLNDNKENSLKLYNDSTAIKAFNYLISVPIDILSLSDEHQKMFVDTIISLVINEWSIKTKNVIKINQNIEINGKLINKTNNIQNIISCLTVLNNSAFECILNKNLLNRKNEFIKVLCLMINVFLKCDNSKSDHLMYNNFSVLVVLCLTIIEKMSRTVYDYEDEWKQFNLLELLIKISQKVNQDKIFELCSDIILNSYDYNKIENDEIVEEEDDFCIDDNFDESEDGILRKRNAALNYVLQSHERIEELFNDQLFLKAVKYLHIKNDTSWYGSLNQDQQLQFIEVITKLMEYLLKILIKSVEEFRSSGTNFEYEAKLIKIYSLLNHLLNMLVYNSQLACNYRNSFQFCLKINKNKDFFKLIFDTFSNENLLSISMEGQKNQNIFSFLQNRLIKSFINILSSIKFYANKCKPNWNLLRLNSCFFLLEIIEKYYKDCNYDALFILPYTIDYDDDEDEAQFKNVIEYQRAKIIDDETEIHKAFDIAFDILKEYNKSPQKIFESRKVLDALDFIDDLANRFIDFPDEHNSCLIDFSNNLIKHGFNELVENFDSLTSTIKTDFNETKTKAIKYYNIFTKTFFSIQLHSNNSIKFCIDYHEYSKDSIKSLFEIINNQTLISIISKKNSNTVFRFLEDFYECIFIDLHNISRAAYKFKGYYTNLKSFDTLLQLSQRLKQFNNEYELLGLLTIANTASNDDLNNFSASINILGKVAELLKEFALQITSFQPLRNKIQVNETDQEKVEVIQFSNGWNLAEIIEACKNLAVNDNIKGLIYDTLNVKEYLRSIIYKGNEAEQECAFKLLHQLCFDKKIQHHVKEDTQLINFMKNILDKKSQTLRKGLKKICEGIMWMLNSEERTLANTEKNFTESTKHIMISYNSESRQLCLEIKKKLESFGHKIWIDVENIHGSSIDAMAKAVEQAWCVLVCMTEKYKASENCRLEAEYVLQLKKPFVPLIMQKKYKPDGWLGMMLGTKIYIDYTKYDVDECTNRLVKELNQLVPNSQMMNPVNNPKNEETIETKKEDKELTNIVNKVPKTLEQTITRQAMAYSWSEVEVEKWFEEKHIPHPIQSSIWPCNGKVLEELHSMYTRAPEFYYSSLRSDANANIKHIAIFTSELKLLFK